MIADPSRIGDPARELARMGQGQGVVVAQRVHGFSLVADGISCVASGSGHGFVTRIEVAGRGQLAEYGGQHAAGHRARGWGPHASGGTTRREPPLAPQGRSGCAVVTHGNRGFAPASSADVVGIRHGHNARRAEPKHQHREEQKRSFGHSARRRGNASIASSHASASEFSGAAPQDAASDAPAAMI